MRFRGQHEYTLDPKGRISLPSEFRALLQESGQESIILTNYDRCIYGYSIDGWAEVEEKLAKLPSTDEGVNNFLRFFVGASVEVAPDKQGRILIPPPLRTYAGLEKDVVIIGLPKRFEIWSAGRLTEVYAQFEKMKREDPQFALRIASIEF